MDSEKKKYLLELLKIIKTKKYITINQLKDDIDEFKKILKQEGNVYNKNVFELNFKGFFEKIGTIYESFKPGEGKEAGKPATLNKSLIDINTLIHNLKDFNSTILELKELLKNAEGKNESGSVSVNGSRSVSENGSSVGSVSGNRSRSVSSVESGEGGGNDGGGGDEVKEDEGGELKKNEGDVQNAIHKVNLARSKVNFLNEKGVEVEENKLTVAKDELKVATNELNVLLKNNDKGVSENGSSVGSGNGSGSVSSVGSENGSKSGNGSSVENGSRSRSVSSVGSENGSRSVTESSVGSGNGSENGSSVESGSRSVSRSSVGSVTESGSEIKGGNKETIQTINNINFNDGTGNIIIGEPFLYILLSQILSFLILEEWLNQDENNKVVIATDTIQKILSIGSDLAENQWKPYNNNIKGHLTSFASKHNIDSLSWWLFNANKGRVFFEPIGTQNEEHIYGKTVAHVWGANINNFNLKNNEYIEGDGQARAFDTVVGANDGTQQDGIFGVVSTPYQLSSDKKQNKLFIDDDEKLKLISKRNWPVLNKNLYESIYSELLNLLNFIPADKELKKKVNGFIRKYLIEQNMTIN
jgi:hypothetical protein